LGKVLIVDDDPQLRQSFEKLLIEEGHTVQKAANGESGLAMVRESPPDLVVMDVRLPGISGLETSRAMRKVEPKLPIIIMTAYGTTETAIEATKEGAFDYVLKPFNIPDILALVGDALEAGRLMHSRVEMDTVTDKPSADAIIGRSKPMQEIYKAIARVASTDATVLIRGESGTGKELVARAIYQHSKRVHRPFLVINCVAIPETLLESELFGYERGAFTGAVSRRLGKIQQANGGTIFLDEISAFRPELQAKLLRVIQDKEIVRLGSNRTIKVNVRILAATNTNLEGLIEEGNFRRDLYFRLNVIPINLPPLREREGDVRILAQHFLNRCNLQLKREMKGFTDKAIETLERYPWPGNIRELENLIERLVVLGREGDYISYEDLPLEILLDSSLMTETPPLGDGLLQARDNFEKQYILKALKKANWNQSEAARILRIHRNTLIQKMKALAIKESPPLSSPK